MSTKICTKCKVEQSLDSFLDRKDSKIGKRSHCISCVRSQSTKYSLTLIGNLRSLLRHAKFNAKKKLAKDRIDAGVFELSIDDIQDLWKKQDGRCYYSNIQMNYDAFEWRTSLERLNPEFGYVKTNVVLTCFEFNTCVQWSIEKVLTMLQLLKKESQYNEEVVFELVNKPKKQYKKVQTMLIDNIEHVRCNYCSQNKTRQNFDKELRKGCKECKSKHNKQHRETPRGALKLLLRHAKASTAKRSNTNTEKRDNTHDIDFEFLVELYKIQKGLCAYSGIPMQFECGKDWKISLERINVLQGYTRDNVCLICREFNTSDLSIRYINSNLGRSSWSKEKFALFVKEATEKYFNEASLLS